MTYHVTNQQLADLLRELGFEHVAIIEKRQKAVWRHPAAGTELLLPANKATEPARLADILSVRTRLDYAGHLGADAFDDFAEKGTLPAEA
jgi:hypothetical protein